MPVFRLLHQRGLRVLTYVLLVGVEVGNEMEMRNCLVTILDVLTL